ncbi:MAG: NAD(P)H-quinone oxidoreductase [Pseudomonadota bacterium]
MSETMKAVCVLGDAPLSLGDVPRPSLKAGEVLVKIAASGLNRADLLQRKGMYPPPPGASDIMGLECAGEIAELGDGVTGWSIGDRVCALLAGGGYAEYAAVDAGSLFPIPDGMSFTDAACLPEAMMTVWANVYDRCAFQPNEAFLVHGGTSGIGVMAIQMARVWGADAIYATAGSDEKCATATALGATRAINYRTEDFEAVVKDAGGVDVILDMVGGDYVEKNISIARVNGRIVNIAYMNGPHVSLNLMPLMLKRLVLTGTTLRARPVEEKARIRAAVETDFWPAIVSGEIKPVLDTAFPAAEADAAQALMTKGGHVGKIVLEWGADG